MDAPLEGRTALVTGGSRGIGAAIALGLAEAGAAVAVNYRRHADRAEAVVDRIRALGRPVCAVRADVAVRAEVEAMVAEVVEVLGPPDILVNNAGIASRYQSVADLDPEHFEKVVRVHGFGTFHCSAAVLPHMRTRARGDIVMISSIATRNHGANGSPYNVGKAMMEELACTLANEERDNGIHVNIVAPGVVVSDMGQRLVTAATGSQDMTEYDALFPFGHVARPEEVAAVVVALCGPAGGYLTGQRIQVDGGGMPLTALGR